MRNLVLVLTLSLLAACGGESALPNPTGKGTVRAINAISASPSVRFLIEERLIESVPFGASSSGVRYDDFQYIFNFEVQFLGEATPRRVASPILKVEKDRDYTFVLTGALDAPTITVWETGERVFTGTETTFQTQFAHTAESLGALDFYFADPATAPAIGEQRATLNFGEVSPAIDLTAGDFVLTVTVAGDPTNVVYMSDTAAVAGAQSVFVNIFEGNENDTAPYVGRIINTIGGSIALPDPRFPPTIRFIQAAINLANADVYDDEMLTSQVLMDFGFGDVTGDIDSVAGTVLFRFTPVGDTSAILLESGITNAAGRHHNFVVVEIDTGFIAQGAVVDRRTVSTFGKLKVNHASRNQPGIDLYVLPRGEVIDQDSTPFATYVYTLQTPALSLEAGSYDLYMTIVGQQTIIAGPLPLDIALGEFVEAFIFDTVDPNVPEFRILPTL